MNTANITTTTLDARHAELREHCFEGGQLAAWNAYSPGHDTVPSVAELTSNADVRAEVAEWAAAFDIPADADIIDAMAYAFAEGWIAQAHRMAGPFSI